MIKDSIKIGMVLYPVDKEVKDLIHSLRTSLTEAEKRVKVLDDINTDLVNGFRCFDCEDTGMLEDSVDGRYPCTCITETDFWEWNESRLRDAEGREAVLVESWLNLHTLVNGGYPKDHPYTLVNAKKILATLPTRTAAVLAVMDAAREYYRATLAIREGKCRCCDYDEAQKALWEATGNLDKEV